ncbi:hypothetical protein YC2023_115403 [Brassica napus]
MNIVDSDFKERIKGKTWSVKKKDGGDGIKPMKTVRPDEFGSPYSKNSILSIADSNDNQTR